MPSTDWHTHVWLLFSAAVHVPMCARVIFARWYILNNCLKLIKNINNNKKRNHQTDAWLKMLWQICTQRLIRGLYEVIRWYYKSCFELNRDKMITWAPVLTDLGWTNTILNERSVLCLRLFLSFTSIFVLFLTSCFTLSIIFMTRLFNDRLIITQGPLEHHHRQFCIFELPLMHVFRLLEYTHRDFNVYY